jgi:hypothetical protein
MPLGFEHCADDRSRRFAHGLSPVDQPRRGPLQLSRGFFGMCSLIVVRRYASELRTRDAPPVSSVRPEEPHFQLLLYLAA